MAVMRSGRHFAQFTVLKGLYLFFGVSRPGWDVCWAVSLGHARASSLRVFHQDLFIHFRPSCRQSFVSNDEETCRGAFVRGPA